MPKVTNESVECLTTANDTACHEHLDERRLSMVVVTVGWAICHELAALREVLERDKEPTPWITKPIVDLSPEQKDAIAGLIEEMMPGVEHNLRPDGNVDDEGPVPRPDPRTT